MRIGEVIMRILEVLPSVGADCHRLGAIAPAGSGSQSLNSPGTPPGLASRLAHPVKFRRPVIGLFLHTFQDSQQGFSSWRSISASGCSYL